MVMALYGLRVKRTTLALSQQEYLEPIPPLRFDLLSFYPQSFVNLLTHPSRFLLLALSNPSFFRCLVRRRCRDLGKGVYDFDVKGKSHVGF